jgi:hypothetical protein
VGAIAVSTDVAMKPTYVSNTARNYQEKGQERAMMTVTQQMQMQKKINIAAMTCGSKKLAKKRDFG